MKIKYPVYIPYLQGNEKKYVNRCLDSTWISSKGEFIQKFENAFSDYLGIPYCTGVCNGTVAIHNALLALGLGPGDDVLVPSFTYIASVNPIKMVGANPVFVDSHPVTWQMDPADLELKVTGKTKAIMVVHLYGHPCDMNPIMELARKNNLYVIEDCAEAFGTKYENRYAGSFGDIATFSFFGNKTISTGEGGMVASRDKDLFDKAFHFKTQALVPGSEYLHDDVGYNYRMTNVCAAIGLAQLENADHILEIKRNIATWYIDGLAESPVDYQRETGNVFHTYWLFSILAGSSDERTDLRKLLAERGVETRPTFHPAHKMPMYEIDGGLPVAEDLGERGISLPSYPGLKEKDVRQITEYIQSFYS